MRRGALGLLLLCACGARSEIAGGGGDSFDASSIADVKLHDVTHADAGPIGDAGADAVACTPAAVKVACGGDCSTCKFSIQWTCGDLSYQINGGCDPADAGGPFAGAYFGGCSENGKQTSTFDVSTVTCDCNDESALVTLLQDKCTHQ